MTQLRLWDTDGWRHQVTLTNSAGDALVLELRQRRDARVENCIKALRDTGLDRMPFASFAANEVWLELVLAAADLLAWLRRGCLDGTLSRAEPKALPTACCTSLVASCVGLDASSCGWPPTGHGPASWPRPIDASPP